MHIIIVEDEGHAAERLRRMVKLLRPDFIVDGVFESIEDSVAHLKASRPDLILMDIQLADGLSFSIFEHIEVECPVIFTTAFDEYALRAFKQHSIDYLLKPIGADELSDAIQKFEKYHAQSKPKNDLLALRQMLKDFQSDRSYRKRFMVRSGNGLMHISVEDVAYFLSTSGTTFLITHSNERFMVEHTLDVLENELHPDEFFRVSRKCILAANAIQRIEPHLSQRLFLELRPHAGEEISVSRQRARDFRAWLDK
ncbi:MAG: response regulator [Cryomorphaceae bacterium]|nr:response regulator [Cryomorphaceae bacterium]